VVLGNLDYHNWSKASTAAPVMSQLELRFLTALAVFHKRTLKNCDSNLLSSLLFLLKKNILFTLWLAVRSPLLVLIGNLSDPYMV